MFVLKNFVLIWIFSDIEWKTFTNMQRFFGLLVIMFQQECKNCLLYVLENSLRESVFFGNRHSLLTFSNTDWKTFGHLSNVFGGGSPNWFLREQRYKLSGKEVSEKITFYRFRLLGKNFFSVWLENFWRDFQKYILRVQRNIFRIEASFENLAFFSHFWRQRKFFRPFGKVFSASLPKLILHVRRNALRKKRQFWKTNCFFSYWDKGQTYLALWQNVATWLSKLFSTCPLVHFEGNDFFF